jgi:hypothetical protein
LPRRIQLTAAQISAARFGTDGRAVIKASRRRDDPQVFDLVTAPRNFRTMGCRCTTLRHRARPADITIHAQRRMGKSSNLMEKL